jgi:outer membrane protein assembly factor BamB
LDSASVDQVVLGNATCTGTPMVVAWDRATGARLWTRPGIGYVVSGVALISADNTTVAMDERAGAERWRSPLEIVGPPTAAIAPASDSTKSALYGLSLTDGKQRWKVPAARLGHIEDGNEIAGDGGRLYFVDVYGSPPPVIALDEQTGAELWRSPMAESSERSGIVADAGLVFRSPAGDLGTSLEALDGVTGRRRWRSNTVHFEVFGAAIGDGNLYATGDDESLVAVNERTGATKWTASGSRSNGHVLGAFRDGVLYSSSPATGNVGDVVVAHDAGSGAPRWRFATTPAMGLVLFDTVGAGASPGCPGSD